MDEWFNSPYYSFFTTCFWTPLFYFFISFLRITMELNYWQLITKLILKTHTWLEFMCRVLLFRTNLRRCFSLNMFAACFAPSSSKFRYALFNIRYNYQFIAIIHLVKSIQKCLSLLRLLIGDIHARWGS